METKLDILRRYFGYTSFRRGQEEIVDALLTGRDALCVMPTDEQELLQVSGVGERKAHRYGKAFLEEINRKAEEE